MLSVATHPMTAVYSGDTNVAAGTSATLNQVVNKASTTVAVTTSGTPAVYASTVTFTATVNVTGPGSTAGGNPTGTVTFTIDGTAQAPSSVSTSAGVTTATFSTSTLTVAGSPHSVSAVYNGDGSFNASASSSLAGGQTITQATGVVSLSTSGTPSVYGQSVTFTATVTPGSPTGTVTFKDGVTTICNAVALAAGSATCTTSTLSVATHPFTATYSGDTNVSAATSATVNQVVNKADTSTALATSGTPTVFGQSVTFTATVSVTAPGSTAGANPTGTVDFKDGATIIGSGTLSTTAGVTTATFSTTSLAVGTHSMTAVYNGDSSFNGSTSSAVSQVVNKANSSTAVVSSVNPSVFGQSVTFTATVTAVAPGAGTPSGTVTFKDGGVSIGTGTLAGGSATLTTSSLAIGAHSITVDYAGDSSFNTSSSATLTQTVNKTGTTGTLTSSVNPSTFGQSVTFTVTVTSNSGGGRPTGNVTFKWQRPGDLQHQLAERRHAQHDRRLRG
jgi:hypothetical protein